MSKELPQICTSGEVVSIFTGEKSAFAYSIGWNSAAILEFAWQEVLNAADDPLQLERAAIGYEFACRFVLRTLGRANIGDYLWIKETWRVDGEVSDGLPEAEYEETSNAVIYKATNCSDGDLWRSRTAMPRWASRIVLRVHGVGITKLQKMNPVDAVTIGMPHASVADSGHFERNLKRFWNNHHGTRRGYEWDDDPWIWLARFRRIENVTESLTTLH